MNISVIGTGYVGLVTGTCLAELGMNVLCMDSNPQKVHLLQQHIIPIYEPELDVLVKKNHEAARLQFTDDMKKCVEHGEVLFIAVNTPTGADGTSDLHNVFQAAEEIAEHMQQYRVIVTKSTVPVGTGQQIKQKLQHALEARNRQVAFDVVSNPEFLREGCAVRDFMQPERIVIGVEGERAQECMTAVYLQQSRQGIPILWSNLETAEMIKYASNTYLAVKISFINEIAHICELCSADVRMVAHAMGMDRRIGPDFLRPGPGFGGSCLPKDTRAFISIGKSLGYTPQIAQATLQVNESQPQRMVSKILHTLQAPADKVISVLGLAFKAGTDDIRDTPALPILQQLLTQGAVIRTYDPQAMENMKQLLSSPRITYCPDAYSACNGSDCILIVTEWPEFAALDFTVLRRQVRTPVCIDLRNILNPEDVQQAGFSYEGLGVIG